MSASSWFRVAVVLLVAVLASAGNVARAALEIDLTELNGPMWEAGESYWSEPRAKPWTASEIEVMTGFDPITLYKAEAPGKRDPSVTYEGHYKDSYSTAFDLWDDFNNATISHVLGESHITESPLFLHVKGGIGGQYLFKINDLDAGRNLWDGKVDLNIENFKDKTGGGISYVAFYAPSYSPVPVDGNHLPEPASFVIWGAIGLFVVGCRRRRR